jgi:hypothetical protein
MWPIQLAFLLFISIPWLYRKLLHFSHDRPKWSSPSFSSTTFQNFPGISDHSKTLYECVTKTNMVVHWQTDRQVPYRNGFLSVFCFSVVTWKFWSTWLYYISSRVKGRCTLQSVCPSTSTTKLSNKTGLWSKTQIWILKFNEEEGSRNICLPVVPVT